MVNKRNAPTFRLSNIVILLAVSQIFSLFTPALVINGVHGKKQKKNLSSSAKLSEKSFTPLSSTAASGFELPHGKNIFNLVGGSGDEDDSSSVADESFLIDPSSLAKCFCATNSVVDDCSCTVESVDRFNHQQIQPLLQELLQKPFFRYYKVNINRECPFWSEHGQCTMRSCGLSACSNDELPPGIRNSNGFSSGAVNSEAAVAREQAKTGSEPETCEAIQDFGAVDANIELQQRREMARWAAYSAQSANEFCLAADNEAEFCPEAEYIDLLKNPERYTGYRGESAWKVWRSIYRENCFAFNDNIADAVMQTSSVNSSFRTSRNVNFLVDNLQSHLRDMCMEKRTFYRLISGMHSSINIHLSAKYPFRSSGALVLVKDDAGDSVQFKPNLKEFHRRFHADLTHGQGPLWLTNLYFAYLVELRALQKAGQFLRQYNFFTGIDDEDLQVKNLITSVLDNIDQFNAHFDESRLFSDAASANTSNMQILFNEFRAHFQNVSRIMDCVGCDKCRLWGKLQIHGMGTALRILFHDHDLLAVPPPLSNRGSEEEGPNTAVHLRRNEIIALLNGFGRLSSSLEHLLTFRNMAELSGSNNPPADAELKTDVEYLRNGAAAVR